MAPSKISSVQYDKLVVSNQHMKDIEEIKKQLSDLAVPPEKTLFLAEDKNLIVEVKSSFNSINENTDGRTIWLKAFSEYVKSENISGNVAECGVNNGEFSFFINKYFSDRKLYLFDTFSGFAEEDLKTERAIGDENFLNGTFNRSGCFKFADVDIVKKRMLHLEKCEFHIGYFPNSAKDVNDEFCFVNLDMDLYQPMYAGLEFFIPKMTKGGVILAHDYFHPQLPGVKKAFDDYEKNHNVKLHKFPIADYCSMAIVK